MKPLRQIATALVHPPWSRLRSLSRRAQLTGVAMLLLGACLFEPRWTTTRNAYDFVITLDITQSMNVADVEIDGKPASRLDYAKKLLRETLPELPCGSRVGWAIFSEHRVLLLVAPIEVCSNYHDLLATLQRINGNMAWANASEVSKGLFWNLRNVKELGGNNGIVFITDGQESPPLNPRYRPALEGAPPGAGKPYTFMGQSGSTWQAMPVYDGKPGDIRGLIVGVGGDELKPIPKNDSEGRSLGFWQVNEVMQTDMYSAGRTGSVSKEAMVEADGTQEIVQVPTMTEHLSSLRGGHLRNLARDTELGYHRLSSSAALLRAMTANEFAHAAPYRADMRVLLAGLALALLIAIQLPGLRQRLPWRRLLKKVLRRQ